LSETLPDRADALELLESWVENDGLRKHMLGCYMTWTGKSTPMSIRDVLWLNLNNAGIRGR
jgi:hypothetical protein